jgi:aryl-alcohol dehydrogenase-like predicted oxidoreductase
MRQRTLGTATISAIGCGEVRLATSTKRGVDARDVERALHEAFAHGVTFVDVADEDGAERLCGDLIRGERLRDRVVVATRVAVLADPPGTARGDTLPVRLPARYVQDRVEGTLRTTRLDVLPYVQLPLRWAWRSSSAWPELADTCARLVREGKVLQWGALVDDPSELIERAPAAPPPSLIVSLTEAPPPPAVDKPRDLDAWIAGVSIVYSLCDRRGELLLTGRPTVLARQPLAGGALAGALGPGMRLAILDDRRAMSAATLERIAIGVARLAPFVRREPPAARSCDAARAVIERAERRDDVDAHSLAELALRYAIDRGALALPRLHRREHLAEALAAASAPPLANDLVADLDELNLDT